jgi:hypothetical protein
MRGTIPDSIGNLTALAYVLLQSCDIVLHVEIAVMRDACQLSCALRVTSVRSDVNACVFRRATVVWCIVSTP